MARFFKLHKNYAKFTGLLGGVYTVKEGIAHLPDSKEEPSWALTESYGGVECKTLEEAQKLREADFGPKEEVKKEEAKK
jgi:hypothetical protein